MYQVIRFAKKTYQYATKYILTLAITLLQRRDIVDYSDFSVTTIVIITIRKIEIFTFRKSSDHTYKKKMYYRVR